MVHHLVERTLLMPSLRPLVPALLVLKKLIDHGARLPRLHQLRIGLVGLVAGLPGSMFTALSLLLDGLTPSLELSQFHGRARIKQALPSLSPGSLEFLLEGGHLVAGPFARLGGVAVCPQGRDLLPLPAGGLWPQD